MLTSPKPRRDLFGATLAAMALMIPVTAWGQAGSVAFISESGDPVGQGQSLTLHEVATARISESEITVEAFNADQWFYLVLAAPEGETLKRGTYDDVVRASASRPAAQPGLYFYGNNRGCESIDGRFEIEEIRFGAFGYVEHLRANFEQRCDGSSATLFGDVIIDNPPKPQEMRVRLQVEPQALLVDEGGGSLEARPYIRLTCEYVAGGQVIATLQQPYGEGDGFIASSIDIRVGCSPTPTRIQLPIRAGDAGGGPIRFHPGSATLNVAAYIEDPNYAQYETDAEVIRSVSRRIRLRLP